MTTYRFGAEDFDSIEAANVARAQRLGEIAQWHREHTVAAVTVKSGDDAIWKPCDLDTFTPDVDSSLLRYHVFNHRAGQYVEAATLDEAKQLREQLIQQHLTECPILIFEVTVAEDGTEQFKAVE